MVALRSLQSPTSSDCYPTTDAHRSCETFLCPHGYVGRGIQTLRARARSAPLSRDQHASYRGLIVRNYRDNPTHLETYDHDSPSQSCLETYAGLPRSHFEDAQQCLQNFFRRSDDRFRIIFFWRPFWRYLLAGFALSFRRRTVARAANVPAA